MTPGSLFLLLPVLLTIGTATVATRVVTRGRVARSLWGRNRVGRTGRTPGGHVLIVSGSYGAGHDAAAREIRVRLADAGWETTVADIVEMYPAGIGRILRRLYFAQLEAVPGSWAWLLRLLEHDHGLRGWMACQAKRVAGRLAAARLSARLRADTACVISTHPFASQALGELRRRGALGVATVTYLTDASVHAMWIHHFVDQHIAVHEEAVRQARCLDAADAVLIQPLTPCLSRVGEPSVTRRRLGLPANRPVALVTGGSEGVGELARTAREIRDSGAAVPVVACGRNHRLKAALDTEPGIVALGWLDGLSDVIAASDCVVQNSGGFTTLETLALGVPLISYRCLPGHGVENARALEAEALAPWPRASAELAETVTRAVTSHRAATLAAWESRPHLLDVLPVAEKVV